MKTAELKKGPLEFLPGKPSLMQDYIAHGSRPLSTVDDESIVKLIKTDEPYYILCTLKTQS